MDEVLARAMEPVLRDLPTAGIAEPRITGDDWTDNPDTATAMLWSSNGSGTGVYISRSATEPDRTAMITDQIQDWAIEQLWGESATNWPPCPNHPESHPMKASTREGVARWVCPTDGMPFSPIGDLQPLA
jgi:hypothetical protein